MTVAEEFEALQGRWNEPGVALLLVREATTLLARCRREDPQLFPAIYKFRDRAKRLAMFGAA